MILLSGKEILKMNEFFQSRIVFLYNNYEREHWNNELIGRELTRRGCKIYEVDFCEPNMLKNVMRICPEIIVTFPITTNEQRYAYALIKKITRCIFITFTTEGYVDFEDQTAIKNLAGYYNYSSDLIDYHMFWGKKAAESIGRELYKQNKLKNTKQIRVFGNPMYEKDKIQFQYSYKKLDELTSNRNKVVLILTGFSSSEYTENDIVNAQDLISCNKKNKEQYNNELKQTMERIKHLRIYREKYITAIVEAVKENGNVLFVVKLHPIEMALRKENRTPQYLGRLEAAGEGVVIIEETCPIGAILPFCDLVVHYGSTVGLEAYIYKIPTLRLDYNDIHNEWKAGAYCGDLEDIHIVDRYVKGIQNGSVCFKKNQKIEKQLEDIMNYKIEDEYRPSEEMAEFMCSGLYRNNLHLSIKEWLEILNWRLHKFSLRKNVRKYLKGSINVESYVRKGEK